MSSSFVAGPSKASSPVGITVVEQAIHQLVIQEVFQPEPAREILPGEAAEIVQNAFNLAHS